MTKNPCLSALFGACLLAAASLRADNASEAAGFKSALADNLKAGSSFLAEPFGKGLAFMVGSQNFSPVDAKSLLGFNLGLGAGVSTTKIDKSGVKSAALSNGTDLSGLAAGLPDALPLPLATFNAHVGLPKVLFFETLDLGVKVNTFNVSSEELKVDFSGGGAELRGNIFEAGLVSPVTLTLGLGFEQLRTELRFAKKSEPASGSFGAASYSGTSKYLMDLDSTLNVATVKASVSRKLLFVTPYVGGAINVISGETNFRTAHEGSLTFTGAGGPNATISGVIEGKASKPAPALDARLAAGLELHLFFLYLAFGGEYGVISGGSGAHGQIGLQFR